MVAAANIKNGCGILLWLAAKSNGHGLRPAPLHVLMSKSGHVRSVGFSGMRFPIVAFVTTMPVQPNTGTALAQM